jgi:hypothetical protein
MKQKETRTDEFSLNRVIVNEDNFNETTEFIFKSMERARGVSGQGSFLVDAWEEGQPDQVRVTLALVRALFAEKLRDISILVEGQNRLDLGNCKCTHPRGTGICILGACIFGSVGVGKGEISITFNI